MGLDMYLRGEKYLWKNHEDPEACMKVDGFRVEKLTLDIGYWRKHPDLHGYIVQEFCDGKDECQPVELVEEDIIKILDAVQRNALPPTTGFFFGDSKWWRSPEQVAATVAMWQAALSWLQAGKAEQDAIEKGSGKLADWRTVIYQASW